MSYLTQMAGLTVHNFLSAATGIALAVAVIRGFVRREAKAMGNFWVDLTRITLYVLMPISVVVALVLVGMACRRIGALYRGDTLEGGSRSSRRARSPRRK